MMRKAKWFVAAALVMSTAGCVETMDSGYAAPSYGYGYGNGYASNGYYSNGYYAQPSYSRPVVNNYYTTYSPPPTVVTQTRVVTPPHQADRSNDHRGDGRHDEPRHVDRQPSSPPAATHTGNGNAPSGKASSGNAPSGNRHDGSRDHDSDRRS